jgi:hypothetical protein
VPRGCGRVLVAGPAVGEAAMARHATPSGRMSLNACGQSVINAATWAATEEDSPSRS